VPSAAQSTVAKPAASQAAAKSGSSQPEASRLALKSAYTTTTGSVAPLWTAKESGYFAEQGFDVSLALVHAGAPILAALASQDVPIAFAGGQEVVNAVMKGADLVIVGGFADRLTDSIYTAKSITTPEQLKGGALGVTGFGAISQIAGQMGLEKLGLKGQVQFIATGGPPATLAAIETGKVQGGVFSPPQTFKAAEQGLHELIDVSTIDVRVQTTAVATSHAYAKAHPDVVARYLTAVIEGAHRAITDKTAGSAAIAKYSGISDSTIVSKTYDYFQNKIGKDGFPSTAGIQGNINIAEQQGNSNAKGFKPEQFIDTSFVSKLKAGGLLDKLWGKQ
jgi:ABC-type nitrate/sulfonate/bicarbonate transport system substrate-binding protein